MAKKSKKPVRVQDAGTAERPIFATDPEAQQDLQEAMSSRRGRRKLKKSRTSATKLSGGDLDAAVGESGSGEETVGGSVPTPDHFAERSKRNNAPDRFNRLETRDSRPARSDVASLRTERRPRRFIGQVTFP